MNLLGESELTAIEAHLRRVLDALPPSDGVRPTRDAICRYVLAGGKRLRPQLCAWTWERATGAVHGQSFRNPTPETRYPLPLLDLACAWELFHAFLLIHDDIIDEADTRRDRPSLHEELRSLDHNSPVFSRSLAIVAGDLLFSEAMRLFHDADLPPDVYRRVVRLFSRVARTTGFGQVVDICQSQVPLDQVCERTLLREYHWKTAAYTFEGPMLCGAMLAGLDDEAHLQVLSRFALSLGQAYQMHNDLVDLATPARDGCDLLQGKRTVTLLRYRAGLDATTRAAFDRRLSELPNLNGKAIATAEELRRQILASDAPAQTAARIAAFLDDASVASDDAALPVALKDGLHDLLCALKTRYFHLAGSLASRV